MRNRGILRGRYFLGAALLLAAVMTWAIGLMMSPHGETVAKGTEYLRTTIVTFKRNSAAGTFILCLVAAWLLFPPRRPRWPLRDWALAVLLAFLGASSIYTLAWTWTAVPRTGNTDENFQTAFVNGDTAAPPVDQTNATAMPPSVPDQPTQASAERTSTPDKAEQSAEAAPTQEPSAADSDQDSAPAGDEPVNNESDQNQE